MLAQVVVVVIFGIGETLLFVFAPFFPAICFSPFLLLSLALSLSENKDYIHACLCVDKHTRVFCVVFVYIILCI